MPKQKKLDVDLVFVVLALQWGFAFEGIPTFDFEYSYS
jgi:hypothetical protein